MEISCTTTNAYLSATLTLTKTCYLLTSSIKCSTTMGRPSSHKRLHSSSFGPEAWLTLLQTLEKNSFIIFPRLSAAASFETSRWGAASQKSSSRETRPKPSCNCDKILSSSGKDWPEKISVYILIIPRLLPEPNMSFLCFFTACSECVEFDLHA